MIDSVQDSVILDLLSCPFDPQLLVGSAVTCSNTAVELTTATASVVQKILSGPRAPNGASLRPSPTFSTPLHVLADVRPPSPSRQSRYDISSSGSPSLIYPPSPIRISHGCSPNLRLSTVGSWMRPTQTSRPFALVVASYSPSTALSTLPSQLPTRSATESALRQR